MNSYHGYKYGSNIGKYALVATKECLNVPFVFTQFFRSKHTYISLSTPRWHQLAKKSLETVCKMALYCTKNNTFYYYMMTNHIVQRLYAYFDVIFNKR